MHLCLVIGTSNLCGQTTGDYLSTPVLTPDSATAQLRRFLTSRFHPLAPPRTIEKWEGYAAPRIDSLRELLTAVTLERRNPISVMPNGILQGEGFRVEKYLVEVYHGFEISLNLYRPDKAIGRLPLIINPNGFYLEGKAHEEIQARCANFVKMGYVAVSWDFVHTGERGGWDGVGLPENNTYYSLWWRLAGVNSLPMTIGETKAILDYLLSLPIVDPARVAAVGSSQGGFTSLLAAAIDQRIKVVVAASLPGPFKKMPFNTTGQFLENSWFHWEATFTPELMNHVSDLSELLRFIAPRPVLLISGAMDIPGLVADINQEVKTAARVYSLYDQTSALKHDSVSMGHEFNQEARYLAYTWVRRWFEADTTSVTHEYPLVPWPLDSLRCGVRASSETVLSSANTFVGSIVHSVYTPHSAAEAEAAQEGIRSLLLQKIHATHDSIIGAEGFQFFPNNDRQTASGKIEYASGLSVPSILFRPASGQPKAGVLLISDSGKTSVDPPLVDGLVSRDYFVCVADLFGTGEMRFGTFSDRVTSFYLEMFGKTTLGVAHSQAREIVGYLCKKYGLESITLIGDGVQSQAIAALVSSHDRVHGIAIKDGLDAFQAEQVGSFPSRIPPGHQYKGSFQHDDLSFISALIAPKPLMIAGLKDIQRLPVDSSDSQTGTRVKNFYRAFSKPHLFSQLKGDETENVLAWIDRHVPSTGGYSTNWKSAAGVAMNSGNKMINIPASYSLQQNYPNPFNPTTTVRFDLPVRSNVRLEVYDLIGHRVSQPLNEDRESGYHAITWEAPVSLSSGAYFFRLNARSLVDGSAFTRTMKMFLLR